MCKKFTELPLPLLYECLGYNPSLIYIFELLSKSLRKRLIKNVSYLHLLIEELYNS